MTHEQINWKNPIILNISRKIWIWRGKLGDIKKLLLILLDVIPVHGYVSKCSYGLEMHTKRFSDELPGCLCLEFALKYFAKE